MKLKKPPETIALGGKTFHQPDEGDCTYLHQILGREVKGEVRIGVPDEMGRPSVMLTYPLIGEGLEPFPTMFWLIDPNLRQRAAYLEQIGTIDQFESRLAESETAMQRHQLDHQAYADWRYQLLACQVNVSGSSQFEYMKGLGVAGVADWRFVKCLHASLAFHLVQNTLIGDWITEIL